MRTKVNTITSTCVPLPMENIDTDQIIPARFLKTTEREGFGQHLFYDWRYEKTGKPNRQFILNDPAVKGDILVVGKNFGCGSSREHAAWALADYGFKAVISNFFADIFKNNAINNGLLPVVVSSKFLAQLFDTIKRYSGSQVRIDLPEQTVTNEHTGQTESFEINAFKKNCLLKGLDDIEYLLTNKEKIVSFEKNRDKT